MRERVHLGREGMDVCPDQQLIKKYLAGGCSSQEQFKLQNHIAQCEHCRVRIESCRTAMKFSSGPKSVDEFKARDKSKTKQTHIVQNNIPTKSIAEPTTSFDTMRTKAKPLQPMIEGYEILEELPQGGQAIVYKALHTATKTHVAIKVLLPTLLASARARYYFEREAELIASLDHPNIVSIRDSGITHGGYYFVMQYVDGEPLDRYVRSKELSFRDRVLLFNKICKTVNYAHQRGIIHRDLKFANILVDQRCEPHILDFGLAKAIGLSEQGGRDHIATMTGQWAGSLFTMSPEQAAGKPSLIDVRTDVYSLGVILYHILIGQYPYDVTGSTLQILQNIQQIEPTRPRQVIRKFDSDAEAIILTALAKEPDQRYQSVAELQGDIENWLDGRPIKVKSISTIYLLRKIIARHRYTAIVVGLLFVIIIAFAYVSFDSYITAKRAKKESDAIAQQWAAEAAKHLLTIRQMVFTYFLQSWQQGRDNEAERIADFLTRGTREESAARFLLDPRLTSEKQSNFRSVLSSGDGWFADFIVGESYLRSGNKTEALQVFEKSYNAVQKLAQNGNIGLDRWLVGLVRARWNELSNKNTTSDSGQEPVVGE